MLKEILNGLPPEDLQTLMEAYELGQSALLTLEDGSIVGVYISERADLFILEQNGDWSLARKA